LGTFRVRYYPLGVRFYIRQTVFAYPSEPSLADTRRNCVLAFGAQVRRDQSGAKRVLGGVPKRPWERPAFEPLGYATKTNSSIGMEGMSPDLT
jgi:hypothetical protein